MAAVHLQESADMKKVEEMAEDGFGKIIKEDGEQKKKKKMTQVAEDVALVGEDYDGSLSSSDAPTCQYAVPVTSMIFAVLLLTSSAILLDDVIRSRLLNPKCNLFLDDILLISTLGIATGASQFFCSFLKMKEMVPGGRRFCFAHIIFAVILGFMATTAYTGEFYKYGTGLLLMHTSFLDFIACLALYPTAIMNFGMILHLTRDYSNKAIHGGYKTLPFQRPNQSQQ